MTSKPLESVDQAFSTIDEVNKSAYAARHTEPEGSWQQANEALGMANSISYSKGIAEANLNIGFYEMNSESYDKAFETFHKSLRLLKEINYQEGLALAFYNLGVLYQRLGDYENAMEMQLQSLEIRKASDDQRGIAACKSQTAYINAQFNLYEIAQREYNESIAICRAIGNEAGLAGGLVGLGILNLKLDRLIEAKTCLLESLDLRKKLNEIVGQLGSSNYLADVLLKEGSAGEALLLLSEALAIAVAQDKPFNAGICRLRTNMAKAYAKLKDYNNAELQLEQALDLAVATGQRYQIHDIYFELSKLHKSNGKYASALHFYEHFHASKHEVITLNASAKVKNLETLSKVELREKEIEMHILKNAALKDRNRIIKEERKKSEALLLNILPKQVADELKKNGSTKTRQYNLVTVMFVDFVNFTATAELLSPVELVSNIHDYFSAFDEIVTKHNVEKIKTIGDAYMAAGGVPVANQTNPIETVTAAIEMLSYIRKKNNPLFQIRIGIHTGPVIAGTVGKRKFAYDIWGDTVNIASRLETSGEQGKLNISSATYELVKSHFRCNYRGEIPAKRKGMIKMYFVEKALHASGN